MKKLLLSLATVAVCAATSIAGSIDVTWSDVTGLPTEESATELSLTYKNIDFGFVNCKKGTYSQQTYLQISGKKTPKGYITFKLKENCSKFVLTTGSNASTNITVTLYAGSTAIIQNVKLDAKGGDFTFDIPQANQTAGTVYKLATTNNYNAQVTKMVFTTVAATGTPAGLSFPEPSYTIGLNDTFESPELMNPHGLAVAYDSSDKTVATVDAEGKVTIEGVGTTTISATSAATDTYSEGYASYTLTVLNKYTTLQDYINGTPNKNDKAIMGADLTVVYYNGGSIYVKDDTASSYIYASEGLGYEVGSVIPGGWVGVTDDYSGLYEIKPETTLPASTSKVDVTYPEITEALTAADVNKVAWFKNVVFSAATPDTKTNWTVSVNGADVQFRNNFTLASVDAGTYNVLGAVSIFNGTLQIFPIEYQVVGDVKETVATPVIEPGSGEIEANTKITITCATEGATIYYTVDGNDPTTESAVYGEPINFTEAMTVKAFAVKEGMIDSEIASAEYTLYDPSIVKPTYVTFDFTDPSKYDLTPATQGGNGIDLCTAANPTVTFTEGDVSLKIEKKNSTNNPRLWTVATGQYEVRLYTNTVVTFSSSNNNIRIEKIVFEQNKTDWGTTNTYDPNTFDKTSMTWNGGADDKPQSTFTMTVGAKTFFNKATVYFKDYTAVEGIEADENVEPVYYNLQGVRVANPEKGLYIVVKGNKSSKVMF